MPPSAQPSSYACGTERPGADGHSVWIVEAIHKTSVGRVASRVGNKYRLIGKHHKLVGSRWVRLSSSSSEPRSRPPPTRRSDPAEALADEATPNAGPQPKFKVGDRVNVLLGMYCPGTITAYRGYLNQAIGVDRQFEHAYAVAFDDGDDMKEVLQGSIRVFHGKSEAVRPAVGPPAPLPGLRHPGTEYQSPPPVNVPPAPDGDADYVARLQEEDDDEGEQPESDDDDEEEDVEDEKEDVEDEEEDVEDEEGVWSDDESGDEPRGDNADETGRDIVGDGETPEDGGDDELLLPSDALSIPTANRKANRKEKLNLVLQHTGCKVLSKHEQAARYMGNCVEAIDHFKAQKKNKVTPANLRAYFKTERGGVVWRGLGLGNLEDYEFDHLHPMSSGGYEYLFNYFAMPKALNQSDNFKFYGVEKETYIGRDVAKTLKNYQDWNTTQAQSQIPQAGFQQVRTTYCPRGR